MLKALLFDLDGTLVDSEPLKAEAIAMAFQELGYSVSADVYKEVMGQSWENVLKHFCEKARAQITEAEFNAIFRNHYQKLISEKVQMKSDLVGFLDFAMSLNLQMAVVSSASSWMVDGILSKLSLDKYFSLVITQQDVSKHKPDPEAYLVALQKLGITADEALVFEDSEAGVQAAKAAGCQCIAIRHNFNERHQFSHALKVLNSFEAAESIVAAFKK
ncbi:HAD family hydrolase [Bdellovibrio sp. HCB2-146]|uniref:HAD family hydrolase n=1 Tax=Bdellovibrio sp. HCB2-146 TaxID=3394362 RepID=UPI0039BCB7F4